jgi:hypothetical protein
MVGVSASLISALVRSVAALPRIEGDRRALSLHDAVARARRRARRHVARGAEAREALRRAIGIVDRLIPGGPNCVRRSLLEISLDAGAAHEHLFAGFKAGGGPKSGHAWLESHQNTDRFDAVVRI